MKEKIYGLYWFVDEYKGYGNAGYKDFTIANNREDALEIFKIKYNAPSGFYALGIKEVSLEEILDLREEYQDKINYASSMIKKIDNLDLYEQTQLNIEED